MARNSRKKSYSKRNIFSLLLLVIILPLIVTLALTTQTFINQAASTAAKKGLWGATMHWPIAPVHMALLPSGNVLMWQGWQETVTPVKIWNPGSNTFITENGIESAFFCAGHSLLADGRVLIAGGHVPGQFATGITDLSLYNPSDGSWSRPPNMTEPRWYPSVTTLPDGRAVILSGKINEGTFASTIEVYDPGSNTVATLPGLSTADMSELPYPNPFVLSDGRLAVFGPQSGKVWILNRTLSRWREAGALPIRNASAVMFRPGRILATGGGKYGKESQKKAVVVNMNESNPDPHTVSPMNFKRYNHNLVMLPNGDVLAVGGTSIVEGVTPNSKGTLPAEIWDPATNKWYVMAAMEDPRMYHSSAILLPSGQVLIAGGGTQDAKQFPTAQVFSPPYLFKGARPSITSAPNEAGYGEVISLATPNSQIITKVSLVRLSSNTHRINFDQRYIQLPFVKKPTSVEVTTPENSAIATPGYYMLFIINANGVPSEAKIIKIDGPSPSPSVEPVESGRFFGELLEQEPENIEEYKNE